MTGYFSVGSNLAHRSGQHVERRRNLWEIPAKDAQLRPLALRKISLWAAAFLRQAKVLHRDRTIRLTLTGFALAGYKPEG